MTASGQIIAIGNLKGGTGKSTLALNLACGLVAMGKMSLLLDTDPQLSCARISARFSLPATVKAMPVRDLSRAGDWIDEVERVRHQYNRVLIDLPATLSPALAAAFMLADVILIPTSPSPVDIDATRRTLLHIERVRRQRATPPKILIVPTRIERSLLGKSLRLAALDEFDEPLAPALHRDNAFQDALGAGDWVGRFAPRSRAARDMAALVACIETQLGGGGAGGEKGRKTKANEPDALPSGVTERRSNKIRDRLLSNAE